MLTDFARLWPERFNNKTNGVTPRRWIQLCNPQLSQLLVEYIGDGWQSDLEELTKLERLTGNQEFCQKFHDVKQANKKRLADAIFQRTGIEQIENYLHDLGDYLCQRLVQRGFRIFSSRRQGEKSAVICCTHEKYSSEFLYERLDRQGIITTARLGRLRISPHFYNNHDDIDRLIDCLPAN